MAPATSGPDAPPPDAQFSQQEIADAEEAMCDAWRASYAAIRNVASKNSQDDTLTYVLNLESQVVFDASADYIQSHLRNHPATPRQLAEVLSRLSLSYQDMVLARLADVSESEVEPIKAKMNSAESSVRQECEELSIPVDRRVSGDLRSGLLIAV
ncbi:hypothetical protein [[Mycobacterium] burgundiense]|uniref:Uncharacterized protein n=1 Tax=[Mycobacterium] burgundiense TaxID=3064286 RepID=A0ABN9NQT9_9MYCO|nr:hypothetical protein [Mycolicibacterium sp. MU0053]CAJ1509581.1 hypothetical protein MU0053_004232 [Mycolicibacterium sp. MU0053]